MTGTESRTMFQRRFGVVLLLSLAACTGGRTFIVTGRVQEETGAGVARAQVLVNGAAVGVASAADGTFAWRSLGNANDTLTWGVHAAGYARFLRRLSSPTRGTNLVLPVRAVDSLSTIALPAPGEPAVTLPVR